MWPQELEILSIYAENSETNKPLQGMQGRQAVPTVIYICS
jgi:hypothetical protein